MNQTAESLRPGDILVGGFTVTGAPVVNDQEGVTVPLVDGNGLTIILSAMVGDTRRLMYSSASDRYLWNV